MLPCCFMWPFITKRSIPLQPNLLQSYYKDTPQPTIDKELISLIHDPKSVRGCRINLPYQLAKDNHLHMCIQTRSINLILLYWTNCKSQTNVPYPMRMSAIKYLIGAILCRKLNSRYSSNKIIDNNSNT